MRIWAKICGVTLVEDALAAIEAGADALGVNFCKRSARYCDPEAARRIVEVVGGRVDVFGVFVGASREQIAATMELTGISGVQLHGGEDASLALGWEVPVIRAVAVDGADRVRTAIRERGDERLLLDSPRGGGSGTRIDERLLEGIDLSAIVLAGGLDPSNVAEAIRRLRPWGVDTASGVEVTAGVKDHRLIKEFIDNVSAA